MLKAATYIGALATLALVLVLASSASTPGLARFQEIDATHDASGSFPTALEVWSSRVLLTSRDQQIGSGTVACVVVKDPIRDCTGTYILPRGRIRVGGRISNRASFQLLIVGGSGAYRDAGGTLTAVGTSRSRVLTFSLT